MDTKEDIVQQKAMEDAIKMLQKRSSPLKEAIDELFEAWRLALNTEDIDEDLQEYLSLSPAELVEQPIEKLFQYQIALGKWGLFIAVQLNRYSVEYKFDLKPVEDNTIKLEMAKLSKGSADERKQKVLNANPVLKKIHNLATVAQAYSELLNGIPDWIKEQKNVLNRLIDSKAAQYGFNKKDKRVREF